MGTWTVDDESFVATVIAERSKPVGLTLGTALGDGQVTVSAELTIEQTETLRQLLAVAIGVAQGAPS